MEKNERSSKRNLEVRPLSTQRRFLCTEKTLDGQPCQHGSHTDLSDTLGSEPKTSKLVLDGLQW